MTRAYPGFSDGDMRRHVADLRRQLNWRKSMGYWNDEHTYALRQELKRSKQELKARGIA